VTAQRQDELLGEPQRSHRTSVFWFIAMISPWLRNCRLR
jgi:hypothetical protein